MDLTKDNIPTLIRQIAIPSSIGTLFQTLYNIVDVKFAGLISPDAITAIAKSFPIYFIIIGFTAGLSIGVTALISNAIGKNDEKKSISYSCASYYYQFNHISFGDIDWYLWDRAYSKIFKN